MNQELAIYQSERGEIALRSDSEADDLWITQRQLADVFDVDVRTINEHILNIFKQDELMEPAVIRKFQITAADGKNYNTKHYNLDMAIAVGYRVNSTKATKFRKWATQVLKSHIAQGYSLNPSRLLTRTKNIDKALDSILQFQKKNGAIDTDQVVELIKAYAQTWLTLDRFDRNEFIALGRDRACILDIEALEIAIIEFRRTLMSRGEASALFATEKSKDALRGIIGNIMQEAFGVEIYPTLEEKAAHILYFIVKNHPYNDGNKRTGAFAFIWFLRMNDFDTKILPETALATLTLLIAASDPTDKQRMVSLILELLGYK